MDPAGLFCLASSDAESNPSKPIRLGEQHRNKRQADDDDEDGEEFGLWSEMHSMFKDTLAAWRNMLPGIIGCSGQ